MRKKVAIIVSGGIGGGYFNQGIPVLHAYVDHMAESFDITVYSMIKTDPDFQPLNYKYVQTSASHTDFAFWKILLMVSFFIRGHLKHNYQLVHGIWGFPAGTLAVLFGKIFNIPSIVSLQGGEAASVESIRYGNMFSFYKRKITLWTCKEAGTLTALTRFQIDQLQRFGFSRTDVFIIPYGTEASFSFFKKELSAPFHFIHIANLNTVKDQTTLLKAFQIISKNVDCVLRIIGNGPDLQKLKTLSMELGIEEKIVFMGEIPHAALPAHLHWAHILLHTSLYEGQAVVVAEAAACGVVVAGTNVGLIADWDKDLCIKVGCGDYPKLAAEVLSLINDNDKYCQYQSKANRWASEHTAAHTADSFKKLYLQNAK